ncbi:MAG: hypothetical protein GX640_01890 [Fibrobacter sp.]|nr:hypothetical protein [Fibrobacter sp.]
MTTTKTLPMALDVEKCVVASLMLYPDQLEYARATLKPESFYSGDYQEAFSAMVEMREQGIDIDLQTLSLQLKKRNKINEPEIFVAECTDTSTTKYLDGHIKMLLDYSSKRNTIGLLRSSLNKLYTDDFEFTEILPELSSIIDSIENQSITGNDTVPRQGRILTVGKISDRLDDYYKSGLKFSGVSTGWKSITQHYRPAKGTLNIITGIPGHGKSEFFDALSVNISLEHDWKWSIFSPENFPVEFHVQKLSEKIIGKPMFNSNSKMNEHEFHAALSWIDEHYGFIDLHEDNCTLEAVLNLVKGSGVDGLLIDPWNELEVRLRQGETETDFIGRQLTKLRRFARKQNIAVFVIAHPAKMHKNTDTGKYEPPTPYQIAGSAHWANKADNILTVHRDFESDKNEVDICIYKVKFKVHGSVGKVKLCYDKVTGRYSEDENW